MNKSHMKKNVGKWVRLFPSVIGMGRTSPGGEDWWLIEAVMDDGIKISHVQSMFAITLPYSHLYSWTEDPNVSDGVTRGVLELHVQLLADGCNMRFVPTAIPGQRAAIDVQEVPFDFPTKSGLQDRLLSQGYRVWWGTRDRRQINGEDVIEVYDGRLVRFTHRELLLMKRPALDQ